MAVDVLEQGPEPPPGRSPGRRLALGLAGVAVVVAGALQVRGETPAADPVPAPSPLPRALLDGAGVLTVEPAPGDVLHVRVGLQGFPRAQLVSVQVELPGSAVVVLPAPTRLTDDGEGLLAMDVVPRCPDAVAGLSQGVVRALLRGRDGAGIRQRSVRLDTAGPLERAVRVRCGEVVGVPRLRSTRVALDGPAGAPLRTRVEVSASDAGPVTVVAVRPGPGLAAEPRTPLPLVLEPGEPPVPVLVDLRRGGCGGAPDTPPYVLVLSSGEAVAPSVEPEVVPHLDDLRPFPCGT